MCAAGGPVGIALLLVVPSSAFYEFGSLSTSTRVRYNSLRGKGSPMTSNIFLSCVEYFSQTWIPIVHEKHGRC